MGFESPEQAHARNIVHVYVGKSQPCMVWDGRGVQQPQSVLVVLDHTPVGEECPDQQGRRHDQVEQPPIVPVKVI